LDDNKIRNLLGKILSIRAEGLRQELEAIDEALAELGKTIMQETPQQSATQRATKKKTSMTGYDTSGINWVEKVGPKGPFMLASERDNKNNPEYEKLFKTIKDRWDKKENTWPFWIFTSSDAIGMNKPKKKF